MRRAYKSQLSCPATCGSTDTIIYTYCCSTTGDLVCQACGAKKDIEDPYKFIVGTCIDSAIGFIGKEDHQAEFQEAFPKIGYKKA